MRNAVRIVAHIDRRNASRAVRTLVMNCGRVIRPEVDETHFFRSDSMKKLRVERGWARSFRPEFPG